MATRRTRVAMRVCLCDWACVPQFNFRQKMGAKHRMNPVYARERRSFDDRAVAVGSSSSAASSRLLRCTRGGSSQLTSPISCASSDARRLPVAPWLTVRRRQCRRQCRRQQTLLLASHLSSPTAPMKHSRCARTVSPRPTSMAPAIPAFLHPSPTRTTSRSPTCLRYVASQGSMVTSNGHSSSCTVHHSKGRLLVSIQVRP